MSRMRQGRIWAFSVVLPLVALLPGQALANGTATMRVTSNTTLTDDFVGSVVIARDGVTLDCQGHSIIGNGNGRGVLVDKRSGVTVRNCDVSNFVTGFVVASTSQSTFEYNSSHDSVLANPNQTPGWISGAGFGTAEFLGEHLPRERGIRQPQ